MYLDFLNKDINIKIVRVNKNGYSIKIIDDDNLELKLGINLNENDIYLLLYKHKRFLINHLDGSHTKKSNVIHLLGKEYKLILILLLLDNVVINKHNINCGPIYLITVRTNLKLG